jgi:uncharacterized protein DUF5681
MAPKQPANKKENTKKTLPKQAEPYKWAPGQSGNPSGRPKKKPITEMFERLMSDPEMVRAFEASIANSIRKGGMAGVMYVKEAADRIEGKVTQPIEADITVNLADAIAEARKRAGR